MTWHCIPKDDAWKLVTPTSVVENGTAQLWLRCHCGHSVDVDALEFARQHDLDPDKTPLLKIAMALRCTRCGEKKAHCVPKPYSSGSRR